MSFFSYRPFKIIFFCKHDVYREHYDYLYDTALTVDWLFQSPEKEDSTWVDQSEAWSSGGGTFPL